MSRLAAGGMAEVYLARLRGPMNFSKALAIKVVHPHLTAQEEFLAMLLDEARLSALIKHPNVVDIYELGHAEGSYFIAMEFIDGQSLTSVIQASITGEAIDPLGAARIVADAADGLHAAHELRSGSGRLLGLVHRDVSPGNIMVGYDGGVKIVDFGIAKARGRLTISGVQQFKGKASYVAPEQLQGGVVDRRTDVYSLGVVLWEALTLRRLYLVENEREAMEGRRMPPAPTSVRAEVPEEVGEICLKALQPDPSDRYQTAGDMKDALEAALLGRGFYREAGYVSKYMERTFARQQESRAKAVRKMAAYTMTGEMSALAGRDVSFDEEEDFPDVSFEEVAAAAPDPAGEDLARGTPIDRTRGRPSEVIAPEAVRRAGVEAAPIERRRGGAGRGFLIALLVIAIVGAGGWAAKIYLDRTGVLGASGDDKPKSKPAKKATAAVAKGETKGETKGAEAKAEPVADTDPDPEAEAGTETETETETEPGPEADGEPTGKPAPAASKKREPKEQPKEEPKPSRSAAELYDEGAALFIQGKTAQAKDRFKESLAVDSRHAPAHRGLGLVYAAEGRRDKAIQSFERYLQLRPDASDAASIQKRIEQLQK